MEAMMLAASSPEVALAGLGLGPASWSALPWSALPWREGALFGLPVAGTAAGRIARRLRQG